MIQFSTLQCVFVEIAQCICPNCKIYLSKLNNVQGLSENVCEKLNFYKKNSFLSCFGSEISDKFMPWSIQVHHNHPEATSEAGASNVLSVYGRLLEADH